MAGNRAISAAAISMLLATLITSGCLYIPPIGQQFTEKKQAQIIVGTTTKDEIIELLGKPNLLEDERFFVYKTKRDYGKLIVVLGPPADGVRTDTDGRPGAVNEKMFLVLLEFDDRGIVSRFDLEERKVWFDKGGIPEAGGTTPDGKTLAIHRGTHVELWRVNPVGTGPTSTLSTELEDVFLLPFVKPQLRVGVGLSLDFSRNGKLVAASRSSMVVYDIPNARTVLRFIPTGRKPFSLSIDPPILALAFSPDGSQIATGEYQGVYLWSLQVKTEKSQANQ